MILASICSTPFGVGGMVVLAPTMGCNHSYSWFDPFRIISLKKLIYGDHIFLFHRPRSGQTMNSPRYNRGYRMSMKIGNPEKVELLVMDSKA